jgi:hypothetical protein
MRGTVRTNLMIAPQAGHFGACVSGPSVVSLTDATDRGWAGSAGTALGPGQNPGEQCERDDDGKKGDNGFCRHFEPPMKREQDRAIREALALS